MVKNLVLIFVLLTLTKCDTCTCEQLKSEYECNQLTYTQCQWDSIKSTCSKFTGQKPENLLSQLYCSSYKTQQECLQKYCQNCDIKFPCAWIMNSCTIFPGCTPFLGTTQAECEKKSKNCVSDGTYCVDLTDCKNYLQQQSCQRNKQGRLCYWENSCDDVKQCSQLKYKTHEECNSTHLRCTVGSTGGCVELQQTCDNYMNQISCQTTLTLLQCIWLNGSCQEKTCETAAVGQDCNSYLNYKICVKSQSGGCETPKTCSDFVNNASCIKDSYGIDCIYVESKCVNKACSSAPQKYYQNCESFLPNCTTDNGLKCIENETCSAFDSQATCVQSKQGDICYWNISTNKCQTRTCSLAKANLTQHSECEAFLFSCTVDPGQGCRTKTCEYAPTEYTTNAACEKYLPNKNCVTRAGGGCITNGECSKLSVQEACVNDINGNPCYWNPEESKCGTKLCSRASTQLKTQEQCQQFIPSCQLAQKGEGCEEKSCENKRVQSDCTKNYQNVECLWQSVCLVKTCNQANDAYTTHDDCQSFMNQCTVSNTGTGCMALPLQCDYIKTKEGCKIRRSIALDPNIKIKKCLWRTDIKKCVEYSCEGVIPDLPITNEGCKKFSEYEGGPKCYINNEENGCMQLPKQCSDRRKPNCDVGLYDCIWNETKNICAERTCINAKLNEYTITSCQTYQLLSKYCDKDNGIGCCTINDTNNGCIQKKNSCLEYQSPNNCQMEALLDGKSCVWKDLFCVDYSCIGLTMTDSKYSHANCQLLNKQCTVNVKLDGCSNIANSCISYKTFEQCVVDDKGNQCIWQESTKSCDLKGCEILQTQSDIKYGQLKDYTSCQSYQQSCTVIQRAEAKGCVPRKKLCSDYKVESQCHKTFTNLSNVDDCVWDTKRCWNKSEVNCQEIVFDNPKLYKTENCESIALKCKANDNSTSCIPKSCVDFTTTTGLIGGPEITLYSQCKALSLDYEKCSIQQVKSKYQCVKSEDKCQDYKQLEHCIFSVKEGNCKWNANKCFPVQADCGTFEGTNLTECQAYRQFCIYDDSKKSCNNGQCSSRTQQGGETLTHNLCQNYDPSCTFYTGDTTCSQIPQSCKNLDKKICTYMRKDGIIKNCLYSTDSSPQCVDLVDSSDLTDYCQKVVLDSYSFDTCQNYSTACSVNRQQTKCVLKKRCTEYIKLSYCYKDDTNYCIQTAVDDVENVTKCKSYSTNDGCNLIFLGKTTSYTHQLCNRVDQNCTNKDNTGCQTKTCENYIGEYNHITCNQWLSTCTVNLLKSGCIKMYENCADIQLQDECNSLFTEKQGYCIFKSELGACIQKTCLHSSDLLTTDSTCSNYMPTCTVALFGGCTQRKSCNLYESQLQCQYDQNSNLCFWNPTIEKCVDFSCDNIEQTIYFSTHKQCFELDNIVNQDSLNIQNRCTIKGFKPEDKKYGCTELKLCSQYLVKEQCVIDVNQKYCIWNETNTLCEEVTCATAGLELRTHEDCQRYKFFQYNEQNDQCTVAVTVDENNNATFQGCMPVGLCENYLYTEQCRVGVTGTKCRWFDETKQCVTYNCEKAPAFFTSHKQCEQYLYDCTVDSDSIGCMTKKTNCSEYNEFQCHSLFKTGNEEKLCVWKDGKCMQRQCDNAPSETQDCKAFLAQCMPVKFSSVSCRTQNCENYQYSTDSECKAIGMNSLCTTDGIRCVLRTTCEDAQIEEACKVNNRNQLCIWVRATASNDAYCKTSECEQAPTTVKKYNLCVGYSTYCTVKLIGGCKVKGDCTNFEESESCINQTALDGKTCRWKDNKCGNYDCSDIKSVDHFDCSKYKSDCTTSPSGICVQQLGSCDLYTIKNQCVQTINQEPCVWMQSILDGKKNEKCVKFTRCEDAIFTDHFSCASISPYCTTNGTNCIPISKCETYQEPGCYKGIDQDGNGNCMYNYASLTSTVKQCLKFTKCTDVYLKLTHQDCQQINTKCTSDGSQGCIDLQDACSGYKLQVPCVITKGGKYCKWDQNICKDETCEQIEGAIQVHQFCNLRQSACTTNGLNCITMKTCSSYTTEAQCKVSWGTEGQCIWEKNQCRRMLCSDIKNPLSYANCAVLKDCVFDGTQCIDKAVNCSDYKTGAACLFETTNKDLCIWADQKCSKAETCNQLKSNQEACDKKTGCSYQQVNGEYQCITNTCPALYELTKQCTFYKDSQENTKYCMFNSTSLKCDEINPINLSQASCFIQSNYTYYWSNATQKCQSCYSGTVIIDPTNNTNSTGYSNLMGISFTMFLGMLW